MVYPTSEVKNRTNSFRILSARFILVKGEGKIRDARGSEICVREVWAIIYIPKFVSPAVWDCAKPM